MSAASTLAAQTSAWMWYLMRGSGAVSFVLLTAALVSGVAVSMRWSGRFSSRLVVEGMHKNLSLIAVAFLGVHVATAVADNFVSVDLLDAVIPFQSGYRPLWIGMGALVLDLFAALIVTSLLRDHIGHHLWRLVHWSAYACWPLALVHSIGAGTDSAQPWLLSVYAATTAGVIAAVAWRGNAGPRPSTPLGGPRTLTPVPVAHHDRRSLR